MTNFQVFLKKCDEDFVFRHEIFSKEESKIFHFTFSADKIQNFDNLFYFLFHKNNTKQNKFRENYNPSESPKNPGKKFSNQFLGSTCFQQISSNENEGDSNNEKGIIGHFKLDDYQGYRRTISETSRLSERKFEEKGEEMLSSEHSSLKRKRNSKKITACPHVEKGHYAKVNY